MCVCLNNRGYLIGDALFTGDTLFMPDYGTARCDFPGGSSKLLYNSIQRTEGDWHLIPVLVRVLGPRNLFSLPPFDRNSLIS